VAAQLRGQREGLPRPREIAAFFFLRLDGLAQCVNQRRPNGTSQVPTTLLARRSSVVKDKAYQGPREIAAFFFLRLDGPSALINVVERHITGTGHSPRA
jgi:hypothetical protein